MDFPPPSPSKTKIFDVPLRLIGFEFQEMSPDKVTGRLQVTDKCCQPFKVLHGGVSAMIAEGVASIGAYLASGLQRVAGVQLNINHLRPADIGDLVIAEGIPVNVGKTIQVWEVRLFKVDPRDAESRYLIASSRVTLLSNVAVPDNAMDAAENLKKILKKGAKL